MNLKMLLGMACLSPLLVMSEERPILSRGETIALAGPEGYDLARLEARVDEAIAREQELIEAEEQFNKNKLDKSAWTIMDKSSEETSGEGENGRAAVRHTLITL